MPTSDIERHVNAWRGWCCVCITAASIAIVLVEPRCFVFWTSDEPAIFLPTGLPGLMISLSFFAYLVTDTAVSFFWRQHFRRSMGAVYLHHLLVGVGVLAFLLPSPPRGFFFYVWGEALTACRILPPRPRWRARHAAFAFRRVLWIYLLVRDVYLFPLTSARRGTAASLVPPFISLLLLALDVMWWNEHAKSERDTPPAPLEAETLLPTAAPVRRAHSAGCLASDPPALRQQPADIEVGNGSGADESGIEDMHYSRSSRLRTSRSATRLSVLTSLSPRHAADDPDDCNTP